jgi:hypothetical protein
MPAETHQVNEPVDARVVLDLLTSILGVDPAGAAHLALDDVELDDHLSILHLWAAVVEEFGERSLGELELECAGPTTLGALAAAFAGSLRR